MDPNETVLGTGPRRAPLGRRLRTQTRAAHEAAEAAFDLDRWLTHPDGYADVLELMEGHLRAWAPAHALVAPRLPVELRDGARRRLDRLRADLADLGRGAALGQPRVAGTAPAPSEDHALGALYVAEGAALGGLIICAEVRRRLPQVAGATRYFAGEGRRTAARWRRFQDLLEQWDRRGEDAAQRVVEGALAAFASLTEQLEAPGAARRQAARASAVRSTSRL